MDLDKQILSRRPIIIALIVILVVLIGDGGFWMYRLVWAPNFKPNKMVYVYIDDRKDFDNLYRQLSGSANCLRIGSFKQLSELLKYPASMCTGRYAMKPSMSNLTLLNDLRRGHQVATRVTSSNIHFKEDLVERISDQLMFGKENLLRLLNDSVYCDSLSLTPEAIHALFIPSTYEIYWNIPADRFTRRMRHEYGTFWTPEWLKKTEEIGLTPIEISVLASIVEEEATASDRYPIVADLYISRPRADIPLQADPIVKFMVGDFSLQRILFEHLEIDSPCNAYKYTGLPPGPLWIPTTKGLNSVLNHTKHKCLYMCAKEDFSGRHDFAVTLAEHNRNANRYRAELNRRRMR